MSCTTSTHEPLYQKPNWLRVKLPLGEKYKKVRDLVDTYKLHTICQSGNCPNMGECWGEGTATFMILGNICTRSCGFCAVATGRPKEPDYDEPQKVAEAIYLMQIKHAVLTSVDRDDIQDGGASIWKSTIKAVRALNPHTTLETLIPDFKGELAHVEHIVEAHPEVVSHNIETVERLTKQVRIQAKYHRSLSVLRYLKQRGMRTKTGLMLGLGESESEIIQTMQDIKDSGTDVLTLGQYLQPTAKHLKVVRFVSPKEFEYFQKVGYDLGFDYVESGPLVRSSYHSDKHLLEGYGRKAFYDALHQASV